MDEGGSVGEEASTISAGQCGASPGNAGEDKLEFNDLFSLRKPKDARAGLASGMKSIAKGVLGGTASLVAAPAVYANQDGWKGLAKGVAVGVAGAAVLPVVGVAIGATQIVRGVYNTPEAIVETTRGRYWDQSKREWVDEEPLPLVTEEQVYGRSGIASQMGAGEPGDAAGYYEMLEVPRDAPPEVIKRQYYFLARKFHPDKNLDDPAAKARFQKLGEAYQVLADPQLRARYDKNGTDGLDNTSFMDGVEFFGMLFGCEQFEYLIGELFLATTARLAGDMFDPTIKKIQHERVETLAVNLKALLERWVHGDTEGFVLAQREEAERLSKLSFGKTMLFAIGRVYEHQGTIYQGDLFQSTVARFKQKGETIRSHLQAAQLTVRAIQYQRKLERLDGGQSAEPSGTNAEGGEAAKTAEEMNTNSQDGTDFVKGDKEDADCSGESGAAKNPYEDKAARSKLAEDVLPLVLEAMWAANVIDIQGTLRKVCRRVLTDTDRQLVRSRAEGLKEMGKIFTKAGTPEAADQQGTENAKETIENAMLKVVEKRHKMDDEMHAESGI